MENDGQLPTTKLQRINAALDIIKGICDVKTDGELAGQLGIHPPVLSKVRSGKLGIGPTLQIRIHDLTSWPFSRIRAILADDRIPTGGAE